VKLRFGRGERTGLRDDAEFIGVRKADLPAWERYVEDTTKKKSPPMSWLVRVHGLRLLGPYDSLAQAWTSYRDMDESERTLLRMEAGS
jgi:hypothetical protein